MKLITDAHISPKVAAQLQKRIPELDAVALQVWRGGKCLAWEDGEILAAAAEEGRTIVTYDQRTMWVELVARLDAGLAHSGVVFVDDRSIAPSSIGGLVKALGQLWTKHGRESWTNRTVFLKLIV